MHLDRVHEPSHVSIGCRKYVLSQESYDPKEERSLNTNYNSCSIFTRYRPAYKQSSIFTPVAMVAHLRLRSEPGRKLDP
jgi:hypothetical protein